MAQVYRFRYLILFFFIYIFFFFFFGFAFTSHPPVQLPTTTPVMYLRFLHGVYPPRGSRGHTHPTPRVTRRTHGWAAGPVR